MVQGASGQLWREQVVMKGRSIRNVEPGVLTPHNAVSRVDRGFPVGYCKSPLLLTQIRYFQQG